MALQKKIRIGNPQSWKRVSYDLYIDGQLEQVDKGEHGDVIDGSHAHGLIRHGWDEFDFRGSVKDIQLDGGAQIEISDDGTKWESYSRHDAIGYFTGKAGSGGAGDSGGSRQSPPPKPKTGSSSGGSDVITNVPTVGPFGVVKNPTPAKGMVGREYSTQGPVSIRVERGTEYESLQEAFNAIPHYINHEVEIHVYGRTKDNDVAQICNVSMANQPHFRVIGHNGAVINNGGVNVHIDGKMDHIRFDNLEFEMLTQVIYGRFENCILHHDADNQCCYSGKQGVKMFIDCVFAGHDADHCIVSIGDEQSEVRNCELHCKQSVADLHSLSQVRFTGNNDFSDTGSKQSGTGGQLFDASGRVA